MWTALEAASQGHAAAAGAATNGSARREMSPEPPATAQVSSSLSWELLTSVFHAACSNAPPSTASVTGSVSSISASADHLLEQRPHAFDRGPALFDRLRGAVVVHRGEIGQERRDQHVGR